MAINKLDQETADRDITSLITVLTHTPSVTVATLCQGYIKLGDGTPGNDLDGTGGSFQLVITVGGQTIQPSPTTYVFNAGKVRSSMNTGQFIVPPNEEVLLRILSPNGADTAVNIDAYLYEVVEPADLAVVAASIQASAASSAAWGFINSGIVFRGIVTAANPGVSFTLGGLAGQGVGAFIDSGTPWYAYVFKDAGGAGAAPQGEAREVLSYTSATGLFTTNAFTVPVAVGDDIIVMSYRIAATADIKAVVDSILTVLQGSSFRKNVALSNFVFPMKDATNHVALKDGLTVSGTISKDGGAFVAIGSAISEIGSSGIYKLDTGIAQAEMNADAIVLLFTATGADTTPIFIHTFD
jgi:hypothetical protein